MRTRRKLMIAGAVVVSVVGVWLTVSLPIPLGFTAPLPTAQESRIDAREKPAKKSTRVPVRAGSVEAPAGACSEADKSNDSHVPMFDESGLVTYKFTEKNGLGLVEMLQMQQVVLHLLVEINVLTLANATTVQQGEKLVIKVRPFDGTESYELLMDHLAPLLGSKLSSYQDELAMKFYGFGAEIRTYEVTRTPSGGYKVSQMRETPEYLMDGEFEFPDIPSARNVLGGLVELLPQ